MDGDLDTKVIEYNDKKGVMIRIFEDLWNIINENYNENEWYVRCS